MRDETSDSRLKAEDIPNTPLDARPQFWWKHRDLLILLAILMIAAIFRFTGMNFDQGTHQHPDERFIVGRTQLVIWPSGWEQFTSSTESPLNLRNARAQSEGGYAYGSLPVYMARAAGWVLDTILPAAPPERLQGYFLFDYQGVTLLGRHLAAIFDLFTVLLVFLIGRRLYSSAAGLIAASLVAFAVTHIQIAHFYASDAFLVTFMMAAIYFTVRLMQRPTIWAAVGGGTFLGLAVASKVSIAPFALIVVAAVVLRAFYRKRTRALGAEFGAPVGLRPAGKAERERSLGLHLLGGAGYVALAATMSFFAFVATEPYVLWTFNWSLLESGGLKAVFDSSPWWSRLMNEADIQSGRGDVPYTRQYVGTMPLVYHVQQMVMWGLGPIPGLVVVAGFVAALWRALRGKPAEVLLMSGALPYFATILTLEAKWMRYMLPLVPVFALLGAGFLVRGIEWQKARWSSRRATARKGQRFLVVQRNLFRIMTGITIATAFLWAVAFMNIYTQEHSRIQASRWIHANVPEGSSTSSEVWDDRMPLGVPGVANRSYVEVAFALYDDRPADAAVQYIRDQIATTDYIVLASNRLYDSLDNLPWRYPVQNRFYDLLFAEKLGYINVHREQVAPELLGISFNDQSADESFTVYDHPRVDVFKKVTQLTDEQFRALFSPALSRPIEGYSTSRHGKVSDDKPLTYEQPLAEQPDLNDYAWNPLAREETQWIGVLLWLFAVQAIGLLTLPIVFLVCGNLPDRGYAFAKLLGLLLVAWGVWMLASARLAPFTVWSILFVIGLLAALSALCWRLGAGTAMREFYAKRRSLIVFYETLFFVAFGAFLVIRLLNPDLWHPNNGGEKPMEFGFLNATVRSPWMPPADPFFAGGYINYYYHGLFIVGCLIKLVGVDPAIGFNLAIPLLYALTFVAAASIVYNIIAWSQRSRGSTALVSRSGLVFGILGSVLMLAIGNMHAFWQVIQLNFPAVGTTLIEWVRSLGVTGLVAPGGPLPLIGDGASFDWWGTRSIIPGTINEYPYWTFLFADLHPHLINMPFTLAALALGINLAFTGPMRVRTTEAPAWTSRLTVVKRHAGESLVWLWGDNWTGVLRFALMALTLGALAVINSWDYPTYLALTAGGALIAVLRIRTSDTDNEGKAGSRATDGIPTARARWTIYATATVSVVILAVVALLAYMPFFLHFKAFFTEILPITDGGTVPGAIMRRTTLSEFLVFWLIFVMVALSYLVARLVAYPWRNIGPELRAFAKRGAAPPIAPSVSRSPTPSVVQTVRTLIGRPRTLQLAGDGPGAPQPRSMLTFRVSDAVSDGEPDAPARDEAAQISVNRDDAEYQFTAPESANRDDLEQNQLDIVGENGTSLNRGGWITGHLPAAHDPATNADFPIDRALPRASDTVELWGARPEGNGWSDQPSAVLPSLPPAEPLLPRHQDEAMRLPQEAGVIPATLGIALLTVTLGLVVLQLITGQLLLALLVGLLGGIAATTLGGSRSAASLVTGALFVGALAVALGVELVYLADHLRGGGSYRMNTVFKFYIQVWVLFAVASASAVYFIMYGIRDRVARKTARNERDKVTPDLLHVASGVSVAPSAALSERTIESVQPLTDTGNWLAWSDTTPLTVDQIEAVAQPSNGDRQTSGADSSSPVERSEPMSGRRPGPIWSAPRLVWLSLFALVFLASLSFTIYGTPSRINDRKDFSPSPPIGTLDGLKFMTLATFKTDAAPLPISMRYDYEAIKWLNENVSGLHVVAERVMGYYREYGMRIASNTGLPMVAGGLHQDEQRYGWQVGDRHRDMEEFYTTPDVQVALNLINKYDIDYIYVGQLEQGMRNEQGSTFEGAKFEQMAEPQVGILLRVFHYEAPEGLPSTSIYQVIREANTIVGAPVAGSGIPGISITPVPTRTPTPMPTPPVDDPVLKAIIADVAANPTDRAKRFLLVEWYRNNGFPLDAARELETIVRQDPNDIAMRHQLGDAYQQAGQLDQALKAWEDARDVDLNNPAAHNKVGIAYLERNRYDDAEREFRAAVERESGFIEAWYHLGRTYEAKGNGDEARKAYEGVLENSREPNSWVDEATKRLSELR